MNNWPTTLLEFWTATASHLWQSTIVIAVLGLLALMLRKAPGRIRNGLWTIGLIKLAIPFQLLAWIYRQSGFVLPVWQPVLDGKTESIAVSVVSGFWNPVILTAPAEAAISPGATIFLLLLTIAWSAITLLLLNRSVIVWRQGRPKEKIVIADLNKTTTTRLLLALEQTGVDMSHLRLSRDTRGPGVSGFLRPRIHLSEDLLRSLEDEPLEAVLLHEEAHRRRFEPLRYGIQRLLFCLFFYFPPLWYLLRQLHDTTEQACDEAALDKGTHPGAYLATLRKVVALDLAPAATLAAMAGARPSSFAKRLSHIHAYKRRSVMLQHRIALLAGVAIFCASGLVAGNAAVEGAMNRHLDQLTAIDQPLIVNFQELGLDKILEAIGDATATDVQIEGEFPQNVTAAFGKTTMRDTLHRLATEFGLSYTANGPDKLVVKAPGHAGNDNIEPARRLQESFVQPVYPEIARKSRVTGMVILQVIILDDGRIGHPSILKENPEGYELGMAALDAVRQWRYEPATQDGVPVASWLTISVQFNLDANKPSTEEPEPPVS